MESRRRGSGFHRLKMIADAIECSSPENIPSDDSTSIVYPSLVSNENEKMELELESNDNNEMTLLPCNPITDGYKMSPSQFSSARYAHTTRPEKEFSNIPFFAPYPTKSPRVISYFEAIPSEGSALDRKSVV